VSQAFTFIRKDEKKYVLRIGKNEIDFLKDQYAYQRFTSEDIPIPKVYDIGRFGESAFYCVTEFVEGIVSDQLSNEEMAACLEPQLQSIANLFQVDISGTTGWGEIDIHTNNGTCSTWKEWVTNDITCLDESFLKASLKGSGLDDVLFDKFKTQFFDNMNQLDEPVRGLVHGDLGFDNIIINNGKVAAFIDWADVGYGDWASEFTRLHFWWPGRYGDIFEFAKTYNFDTTNLDKRFKACMACRALTTLNFAFKHNSDNIKEWVKTYLPSKLTT
jgi:aminoglycoside phosphotransferase (APT) family kinase protein